MHIVVALTLAAALVALPGCDAVADRSTGSEWITSDQATIEYRDEASRLQLAPGWSWPSNPGYAETASDGNFIYYGVNAGRVDAAWYWHCSWARTYFAAATDHDREVALQQVLRLRESAFYKFGLLGRDRSSRDKILDRAAAGDLTPLHVIVDRNCPVGSASQR